MEWKNIQGILCLAEHIIQKCKNGRPLKKFIYVCRARCQVDQAQRLFGKRIDLNIIIYKLYTACS